MYSNDLTTYERNLLDRLTERYKDDKDVQELVRRYELEREVSDPEMRRCDVCGEPMCEGWVVHDDYHACSKEHARELFNGTDEEFEEALELVGTRDYGDPVFYTEWEDWGE